MSRPAQAEISTNQEYRLLEHIDRLSRHREGRRAVHIHLSRLKSENRRDHHLRIAANTFENQVKSYEGQLFQLANQDLFFVYRDVDPAEMDEAVMRLRYLFTDDPLVQDSDEADGFSTWYDLERQYGELHTVAQALYDDVQKRQKRLAQIAGAGGAVGGKPPINPHRLGELIDTIGKADLSNLMRRQAVFAILTTQPPQPLFRELFISIGDLQKLVLPNYDILANRWLFQYLTETLDKRMLAMLSRNDDPAIAHSFSLNLNVSTILSKEFMAFDASLKAGARGTIVLELQMLDVYADIAAFTFARDFARERGYRLCLDGLNELTLPIVDREKLGIDLVKLQWKANMADERLPEKRVKIKEMIERTGKAKIIMCHVDTEDALRFGHSMGIAMYQGRFIDQLVAPRNAANRPR
ncbi:MAG TPA: EAL domain-containing protein [Aliidongia sp.]|nr:EAL domain-containing protein [Aliidongia sp.]